MNVSNIDKSVECLPEGTTMCTFLRKALRCVTYGKYFPLLLNVGLWPKA